MKKRTKYLIGTSLSLASAFGVHEISGSQLDGSLRKSDKLKTCAVEGLEVEGCRELVAETIAPQITENSLGYIAVYTPEAIITESESLAKWAEAQSSTTDALAVLGAGLFLTVFLIGLSSRPSSGFNQQ